MTSKSLQTDVKSWDEMSMDERLEDTGYDMDSFESVDLDPPLDDDEMCGPEEDPPIESRPSGVYSRLEDPDDLPDPTLDRKKLEAEERHYQAQLELEAERLEALDPTLDPRYWRAKGTQIKETGHLHGKFFAWGKESLYCPGNGKRLASHRKTVRRLSRDAERRAQDRDRLKALSA